MRSPFFWQNTGLVLLLLANCVVSIYLLVRNPAATAPNVVTNPPQQTASGPSEKDVIPVPLQVILRALFVMYATVSCFVVYFALSEYVIDEFGEWEQQNWKRRHDWVQIQPGMTKKQCLEILGEPRKTSVDQNLDWQHYCLSALDYQESSVVFFPLVSGVVSDDTKVVLKYPSDAELKQDNAIWWPRYPQSNYMLLSQRMDDAIMRCCFFFGLLLVILSILPVWKVTDHNSLPLYYIAAAFVLFLGRQYVKHWERGYDILLLIPMGFCIVVGWIVRVVQLALKH